MIMILLKPSVLICVIAAALPAQPPQRQCLIKSMVGTVNVRRGQSPKWITARPAMPLREQDAVRTFVESQAEVTLPDASTITVNENSVLEIAVLQQRTASATDTRLRILNGNILSNIKKLASTDSKFEFETPTATASIRGTKVGFDVSGEQTDIRVYEGKVYVLPKGAQAGAEVKSNEMTSVRKGQTVVQVAALKEKAAAQPVPTPKDTTHAPVDSTKSMPSQGATTPKDSGAAEQGLDVAASSQLSAAAATKGLSLTVISPKDGQVFKNPLIPISGVTTPGATVSCGGLTFRAGPDGAFAGQLPVADQEGELDLEIEATSESGSQRVTRAVIYKKDVMALTLNVFTPVDGQKVSTTSINVSGQVTPFDAEVRANDRPLPVTRTSGAFAATVSIPDEEGAQSIDFEAAANDKTVTLTRSVAYQRPPDTQKPAVEGNFPYFSLQNKVPFTVVDRTPNDEITFYREIDGARESETGSPNAVFYVYLQEGVHDYTVYATDLQGNQSPRIAGKVRYLAKQLTIRLRNPPGQNQTLRLPPAGTPAGDYAPIYNVAFTIEGLPDDDPSTIRELVKEVRVTNTATAKSDAQTNVTDTDFEFEVALKRNAANVIEIKVTDIRNTVSLLNVNVVTR